MRVVNSLVLLYNGEYDLICNWLGTYSYATQIDWKYKHEFASATNQIWYLDGKKVGHFMEAENLVFVVVNDAGHMSPYDQVCERSTLLSCKACSDAGYGSQICR